MNKVEKLFINKAIIQPGGWFIFSKKDAIEFISACKKENIRILGIDGFFRGKDISHPSIPNLSVTPDSIQPSIDNSVDFSSDHYIQKTDSIYTDATDFLKAKDENLFFEIVCNE